ncbi:MAG: amidohydrolase family protein, partial [Psychrosphaera sp.]|nr:amidohydrolase family protein [Psychrosphaera sp.]
MKWGLLIIILLAAFFTLLPEPEAAAQPPSQNFVIRNVRLFDGEKVHPSTDLLIEGGVIKTIAEKINNRRNFREIDGNGKTLLPGLVDAHTHVWGAALSQAINFGVTTELDMFSMPKVINPMQQQSDDSDNIGQADVFSATILATAPNGHGTEYGFDIPVLTGPEQAKDFVEQRINQGADYIKIVYNAPDSPYQFSPSISLETLTELVKQTHLNNKLAVVHIDNLISAKQAVQAGVDGLIHSFMDEVADDELIQLMQQNQVFFIPTLTVEASLAQVMPDQTLMGDPALVDYINAQQLASLKAPFMNLGFEPNDLNKAKQSVKKLQQAGITILAGTDAP